MKHPILTVDTKITSAKELHALIDAYAIETFGGVSGLDASVIRFTEDPLDEINQAWMDYDIAKLQYKAAQKADFVGDPAPTIKAELVKVFEADFDAEASALVEMLQEVDLENEQDAILQEAEATV